MTHTHQLSTGRTLPSIGLGTWKSDQPNETYNAVRSALKLGYRHFDCASGYGNEKEIGLAIHHAVSEGEVTRDELFITSKLWNAFHHPDDVQPALQRSLNDLQLDYIDLYLMHWPIAIKSDVGFPEKGSDFISLDDLPLNVTWQAMETLVKQGLTKDIGVSNFSVKKLRDVIAACSIPPAVNQVELHPYLQQGTLVDFCRDNSICVIAYAPLGSGDRPSSLTKLDEPSLLDHPTIQRIANKHHVTEAQVLISWHLNRGLSVIPKSSNPDRQALNLASLKVQLSEEDMADIALMDKHYRYLHGEFWVMDGSPYTLENVWDE
ncbi:aldo-keto reductase family 1 member B10 [Vibrio maritimus]|uniref:Aldo-keto reductase family 1 member B10 n=1 Tax=Vibrio maritimus TaxID=990268 RepID=A0A090T7K5_9VIBR|nr:aldo-keto reductase family 1 member B10 [Vibrio maritimus]